MANTKYEKIHTEPDVNNDNDSVDSFDVIGDRTGIDLERNPSLVYNHQQQAATSFPSSAGAVSATTRNNVMQSTYGIAALILIYFGLSICLTFYQRHLLREFHFPFVVVLYHLLIKQMLSALIRLCYRLTTGRSRIHIDWRKSLRKVAPTGIASGIDIGFSNWGLELVTISLYTMTKSTTIIFILFFAILLGLEKKSWSLVVIVVMISSGLCMFTYKSTQFNSLGFAFLIFASLSSGVRWSFAQLLMQKSKLGLHNPIDMIYFMQPWMIAAILPLAITFEGESFVKAANGLLNSPDGGGFLLLKITIAAFIAFAMEISEFLVLSYTSSLTLSVAGIFKEIFQLVMAVVMNGDQLSMTNLLGLTLCLGGICCHVVHKFTTNSRVQVATAQHHELKENSLDMANHHDGQHHSYNSNSRPQIKLNQFSGQNLPLLDSTDENSYSDSELSQYDNQNASDVIFDVLKRRDGDR